MTSWCFACGKAEELSELLLVTYTDGSPETMVHRPNSSPRCWAKVGPRSRALISPADPEAEAERRAAGAFGQVEPGGPYVVRDIESIMGELGLRLNGPVRGSDGRLIDPLAGVSPTGAR